MGPVEGNQVTTDADRARPQPAGGRGNGHGRGAAGAAPSAPANGREVDPASSRVDVGSPPGGPAENGINQSPGAGHGGSAEDGEADFWDQVAGVVPAPAAEADVAVSKPPRRGGRKKKPESELKRVVRLLTTYSGGRRVYLWSLFLLTVEAVSSIFQPYPIAYLIDYFNSKRPPLDFIEAPFLQSPRVETLLILTVGLILLTMFNSLADSWAEISLARGGRTLGYNTRQALYQRLHRLSLAFHGHRRSGDMITRVTSDVRDVEDFVVDSVSDLAGSILVLVGTLAFLFYKSWQVAIVAILIVPILSFVSNYFSQRIKVSSKKLRAREGDLANTASEMLSSIRVIQTYGRSAYEEKRFADHSRSAMEAALETAGLKARFSWVVAVMEAVVISIVAWLSISLLDSEAITVGTLVLFVILIQNMFKPTRKIIREWTVIGKIFAATERIAEVLDREYAVADRPGAIAAPALTGRVAFDNVSFSYQLDAEDAAEAETGDGGPVKRVALTGVSFELEPGQVVALVGASGAGKSTIAQLIPRLYDPDEGQVRFDGTDIADFTLDSLRAQVSVVLQETILFSGTVAENIAYGREDASQEDVVEAAIKAQAHQFVLELPDGYDTVLGERGANLSGGQRQRLAIARAFIRNTPILILDEPTTGLDSAASEQVIRALETLMQGKTTLIISHDLHLVQSADLIMVLAAGQIVQQGRHRQLLAEPGPYADFCALSGLVAAPEVPEVPAADLDSPDSEGSGADSGNDRSPGGEATAGINADSNGGWHPALSSGHGAGRGRRRGSFREYGRQLSQRLADLSGSVPVVGPLGAGPGRPSSTGPRPSAPLATGPPALGRGDDPSASGPVSIPDPKWVGASPGPSATLPDPVGPSEPELPAAPTTGNAPPTQAGTTAPALSPLLDLDPRTAGAIGQAIPGLALALDSGPMAEVLDRAMFSGAGSRRRVLSVQPGKAMLLAGEPGGGAATVRYQVELLDPITGRRGEELVLGRLFCGPAEAEAYRQKVEVLAAALAGRQGLGGQGPLVAAPPGASNLVVHRYPVDGELPCLVAATDTRGMVPVFAEALDRAGLDVRRVEVSLGAYGRRHRCVLRYNVDVSSRSTGRRGRAVVFGKVYSGDAGEVVARVVPAITRHLVDSTTSRISVPSHLTYVPELHLSLLNRVPGRPVVADVIKATCLGRPLDSDWPTAAAAMDDAARAAAELHGWPHSDAPVRTLGHDVADLRADLRHLRKYSPRLAAHLGAHLDQIETAGIVTTTHPLALAHGDFSLAQLLHDGRRVSIIDFDSACRAEPAMDLGHFLAYLRLAIARYQATPKAGNELYQRLAWRYLDSYPSSMDDRVAVYRALSLLRITVHAWQKLKPARTQVALALLDDEMEKL